MRKSDTDIVGNKLRIRGALHRRLVQAAEKSGVSLNSEMAARLDRTFKQEETIAETVHHVLGAVNLSAGSPVIDTPTLRPNASAQQLQAKLIVAVESLIAIIEQAPVLEREAINKAIDPVKQAITAIDQNALAELRRLDRSES
jgi:hypothetical protein